MPAICLAISDTQHMAPATTAWPAAAWHAEFKRQATAAAIEAAVRSARVEIDRLRRLNGAAELDPEDLVQDLLAATCAGSLKWSPEVVPLLAHLRDKVRMACRRQRRRNWARPAALSIALDEVGDEDPIWNDVEDVLAADIDMPNGGAEGLGRRLDAELRQLVAKDEAAMLVLGQLRQGVVGATEVAAVTGLQVQVVEGAMKRLRRNARQVSPELRQEILATL